MLEKYDKVYPLLLEGAAVQTVWGGKNLFHKYKKGSPDISIGETWELSIRGDKKCKIANGPLKGQTLEDFFSKFGNEVVFKEYDGTHFPLLIKLIDASDDLSVQVHPADDYALKWEGSVGKNELWYIVSADPGAEIIYGLKSQYTQNQIEKAIKNGLLDNMLNRVKVSAGDVFYVPAGLVHAIGKGIIIAEIQQNSDITYRLYDYERKDTNGNKRELHIDKALETIKHFNTTDIVKMQFDRASDHTDPCLIADNHYFTIYQMTQCSTKINSEYCFHVLLCVEGKGCICYDDQYYNFSAGDCWFIPARSHAYTITGNYKILKILPQIKKTGGI